VRQKVNRNQEMVALCDAALASREALEARDKWKQRAFELECQFGDLKGVYVARDDAALSQQHKGDACTNPYCTEVQNCLVCGKRAEEVAPRSTDTPQ
jgi:hypothetical protein